MLPSRSQTRQLPIRRKHTSRRNRTRFPFRISVRSSGNGCTFAPVSSCRKDGKERNLPPDISDISSLIHYRASILYQLTCCKIYTAKVKTPIRRKGDLDQFLIFFLKNSFLLKPFAVSCVRDNNGSIINIYRLRERGYQSVDWWPFSFVNYLYISFRITTLGVLNT